VGLTPTPSSAEVLERVELYLYSPKGPSWLIKRVKTYLHRLRVMEKCVLRKILSLCRRK